MKNTNLIKARHTLPLVVVGVFVVALGVFLFTPNAADAADTLLWDNFNDGTILDDGWNAAYFETPDSSGISGDVDAENYDDYNNEGYSAKLDDYVAIYHSVNATGYNNIKFEYCRKTTSTGSGDHFKIGWKKGSYSSNWSNWTQLESYRNDSAGWKCISWPLPPSANNSNFRIAFFMDAENNDYGWADNVKVEGDIINVCGDGNVAGTEQCDDGNTNDGDGCSANCTWEPATIHVSKVVCDGEEYLPNWGDGEGYLFPNPIDVNTASNWVVESFNHCQLAEWTFQWAPGDADNPDNNTSIAGGAWSSPFSNSVQVTAPASRVWLREVVDASYVPFSGDYTVPVDQDISAEFYCDDDVLNYDNYDFIENLQPGQDYYCVGFNALAQTCGNDIKEGTEECDLNNTDTACVAPYDGTCNYCTTSCEYKEVTGSYCGDFVTQLTYEECDGDNPLQCTADSGYAGWSSCQTNCSWSECVPEEYCGDGIVNGNEECDGTENCTETCAQLNPAEMSIAKSVDTSTATHDDLVTYTITATNAVDTETCDNATLIITDDITNILVDADLISTNPTADQSGNVLTWTFDNVACGGVVTAEIVVQVQDRALNGAVIENITWVRDNNGHSATSAQVETAVTVPGTALLSIIKSVNKDTAKPGDALTYTVTISNSGDADADHVTLTDVLPSGLTFANDNGSNSGDTEKTWTWEKLMTSGDVSVTYDVLVDSQAGVGNYTNTATASADGVSPVSASATTSVAIPKVLGETTSSLTIVKEANKEWANPGAAVTYTVTVTNDGDAPAMNAILKDVLPDGFIYAGTADQTTATWKLGDIVPTESVTRTYEATVLASTLPGKYVNTASVSADEIDPISDTATVEVKKVVVLGAEEELPVTGADFLTYVYLLGAGSILGSSLYALKLTRSKK